MKRLDRLRQLQLTMEPLPPATRRANLWLFLALIVFAIALAITVFLWMRGVVKANGGIVDPQKNASLFALPTAAPCLT